MAIDFDDKAQTLSKRYLTSRDAYVTGYFFTTIDSVPPGFVKYLSSKSSPADKTGWTSEKIIKAFTALSIEVALPTETLKTSNFNGRGGYSRNVPLFSSRPGSATITFQVDQNMEISTILSLWYEYIDRTSNGKYNPGINNYTSNIYGCNFYYATLLPNMVDVVFAYVAEDFFPTSNIYHDFNHALGTSDSLKHVVPFNIGYSDFWVKGKRQTSWMETLLKNKVSEHNTYASKLANNANSNQNNINDTQGVNDKFSPTNTVSSSENRPHYEMKPDRHGNNPFKSNNDGSVFDKFFQYLIKKAKEKVEEEL